MERHRLKREIIATAVTNQTINRMGATFLMRMQEDTGRSIAEVAKAYTISRETLDARALWAQIDALDGKVPESVQIDALEVIWKLQRSFVRWLLSRPGAMPGITEAVNRYQDRSTTSASLRACCRIRSVRPTKPWWPSGRKRACRLHWHNSWPNCTSWNRRSTSSNWPAPAS